MNLQLRDYQDGAVDAVLSAEQRGIRRQLVVLPTGAGKTVFAAALARRRGGRTLMAVGREELVWQSVDKFSLVAPQHDIGVVKAEHNHFTTPIVVASLQSLHPSRLAQVARVPFDLVIYDEAHHAPSVSSLRILSHLGFLPDVHPGRLLVGLTATPKRADGVGLQTVFDAVTYHRSILDLIRAGYLADVRGIRVRTEVDLRRVKRDHGDFQTRALGKAVDTPSRNALVVEAYRQHGEDRKAVAFTVNVAHAQHLAEAFSAAGYAASWVAGELPTEERRARLARFHDGSLQILTNCQVLTEGWDEPSVQAVIMARPTQSESLYTQAVGRGLRPYPGKTDCLVLDIGDRGNQLVTLTAITGKDAIPLSHRPSGRSRPMPHEDLPEDGQLDDTEEIPAVLAGTETVDLLSRSQFVWRTTPQGMVLQAGPGQAIWVERSDPPMNQWTVTLRTREEAVSLSDSPLPVAYAQGVAEDWVRQKKLEAFADKDARWRSTPASAKQLEALEKWGVPSWPGMTKGEASEAIDAAIDRRYATGSARAPASRADKAWFRARGCTVPPRLTQAAANAARQQWEAAHAEVSPGQSSPTTIW